MRVAKAKLPAAVRKTAYGGVVGGDLESDGDLD